MMMTTEINCIWSELELVYQKKYANLFDRFFRSDNVRSKDIDGSGIGLSIADVTAKNIGVDIGVTSEYGEEVVLYKN